MLCAEVEVSCPKVVGLHVQDRGRPAKNGRARGVVLRRRISGPTSARQRRTRLPLRPRAAALSSLSDAPPPDPAPTVVWPASLAAAAANSSAADASSSATKLQLQGAAGRTSGWHPRSHSWPPRGNPHCRGHDLVRRGRPPRPPDHPIFSSSFADNTSATTYPRGRCVASRQEAIALGCIVSIIERSRAMTPLRLSKQ